MSAQDLMARFGCLNQETSVEMEQYFKDKGVDITEDVLNEIEAEMFASTGGVAHLKTIVNRLSNPS